MSFRFSPLLLLLFAFCGSPQILRYQESILPEDSFVYGRFDSLLNAGTTCVLHLKGLGADAEDTYLAASTFGYGLSKVKPGRYKVVEVIVANGLRTSSLPLADAAEFLSRPFQISAGEGVYLGDHACLNVRTVNNRVTRDQVKNEFRFQTYAYNMEYTTNRLIELYGQRLNGRVLRALEAAK